MKKSSVIIFGVLIIFAILVVPKLIKKFSNDSKVDNTNTTTKISNDRFIVETKRMIRNVQHQYLSDFGKWNYYALDGSRDKNSNPVTTKECTSANGIDVTTDVSRNIKQYCRIHHEKEIIFKSFIVTFNASDGQVNTLYANDGTYEYTFNSNGGTVAFDATKVTATEIGK